MEACDQAWEAMAWDDDMISYCCKWHLLADNEKAIFLNHTHTSIDISDLIVFVLGSGALRKNMSMSVTVHDNLAGRISMPWGIRKA